MLDRCLLLAWAAPAPLAPRAALLMPRTCAPAMNRRSKSVARKPALYVEVAADGSDMWRADEVIEILAGGGCGVVPTDTSYSFVTPLSSKRGAQRVVELKGASHTKKPLSLLCRSLADVDRYTSGMDRDTFKMLRANLPGPFTFILRASSWLPKGYYKDGRSWKRGTVGVRIPDDDVCRALLERLDEPLLCSTVPTEEDGSQLACRAPLEGEESSAWCDGVDFVLDAGDRPIDGSTVYDLSESDYGGGVAPALVRQGLGELKLLR